MNRHLTPEEFAESVSAAPDGLPAGHLADCAECRQEVARMRDTLAQFRTSVHELSAQVMKPGGEFSAPRHGGWLYSMRPVAVLAMLLIAVAAGFLLRRGERPEMRQATISDAALLEQIEAQVSREVPRHMEPLLDLVAWQDATGGAPIAGKKERVTSQ